MLDAAIVFFAIRALALAARRAWAGGVVCALSALLAWLTLAAAGCLGHAAEKWEMSGVWMLLLLGPSGVAAPSVTSPLTDRIGAHALLVRSALCGFAAVGFVLGSRRADAYSPLSDEADRWGHAALAFLPPALLVGLELILFAMGSLLAHEI